MATTWKAWKKRLLTIPRRAVRGWFRPVRRLLHPADYGDLKTRNPRYGEAARSLQAPAAHVDRPSLGRRLTRWLHLSANDD